MNFRVNVIWKAQVLIEGAKDREDAKNLALHGPALHPKLHRVKASPSHGSREKQYQERKAKALPRWKRAYELRKTGMKYREIAETMNITKILAAKLCYCYEEYLLNQRTKKAA